MITKKEYNEIANKLKKFVDSNWLEKGNQIGAEVTTNYVLGILKEYMMDCEENKKVLVGYEKPEQIMLYMQDGRFKLSYNGEDYFVTELINGFEELKKEAWAGIDCNKLNQALKDGKIQMVRSEHGVAFIPGHAFNDLNESIGKMCKAIMEGVEPVRECLGNDPFYKGHKQACRSAADVAYKMNLQATGAGEVTIVEKESGCEYENVTQYTLEVKGGEAYLNHNGLHYNVKKLIECYYKCMEENAKCGGKENDSNCKYEDMKYISRRVKNLEKMVEEINKRIFKITY